MQRALGRAWRRVRTAAAFTFFGVGGAVLALGVLPLARRASGGRGGFDLHAQRWIQRGYRVFIGFMEGLGLIRVSGIGVDSMSGGGRLVVPNHPTLIDTALLGALLAQADCIVKPEWADSRALGPAVAAADYIRQDTGPGVVAEAARRLREGRTVLIFPEGTRTPAGERLGRLHRGAAHVALRSGVDILPVAITAEPRTLIKGQPWYDVPERSLELTVRVLEPLCPKDHLDGSETTSLAARKVTAALRRVLLDALEQDRSA